MAMFSVGAHHFQPRRFCTPQVPASLYVERPSTPLWAESTVLSCFNRLGNAMNVRPFIH